MSGAPEFKSTGALLSDVIQRLSGMVSGEVALARAEIRENVRAAGVGVGLLVAAAMFAFVALNVLTGALIAGITALGVEPVWAALGTGIAFVILALVLAKIGSGALKPSNLAPSRTASNLRRDAAILKEAYSDDTKQ